MLVSDDTTDIDITLFPKEYEMYKDIEKGSIVKVIGNVQKRYDKYQIIVKKIEKFD